MRKITPATMDDAAEIQAAYQMIKLAAKFLKRAGAVKAYGKVRAAIPSVEGARRHVIRRALYDAQQ